MHADGNGIAADMLD